MSLHPATPWMLREVACRPGAASGQGGGGTCSSSQGRTVQEKQTGLLGNCAVSDSQGNITDSEAQFIVTSALTPDVPKKEAAVPKPLPPASVLLLLCLSDAELSWRPGCKPAWDRQPALKSQTGSHTLSTSAVSPKSAPLRGLSCPLF